MVVRDGVDCIYIVSFRGIAADCYLGVGYLESMHGSKPRYGSVEISCLGAGCASTSRCFDWRPESVTHRGGYHSGGARLSPVPTKYQA